MISVALIIMCFFPLAQNEYSRPSYQVLLRKRTTLGDLIDAHCYGNIIQSRLVLTSASCLLSDSEFVNGRELLKADELAVFFKGDDLNELIYLVGGIDTYPGFNFSSLDNDIAILRLSMQLPLSERNDIEWVLVADYDFTDSPLEEGVESYVWKNSNEENIYPGYGVIHESNLVGIISYGPPSKNKRESNLEARKPNRFTQLNPYLSWIYTIIQNAEIVDIQNNNYSASLPYRERKTAEIVEEFIEPDAMYIPVPTKPIKDDIETEVEDLTNSETDAVNVESVLENFINTQDPLNENIETKKEFLKNGSNIHKAKTVSAWIFIFNLLLAKTRTINFFFS
ncbi:uncharacterized protein LOC6541694 [Drosophila erecta]|uniref:Peptidase S1 domain-containing protein n=1 Tax=Drosophila erecta TaxID=7220 RepID=B3N960_DROER|nr:uncharacterized protein LOC6541694 [Drosophila erecta]EDV58495.2 uncharacterized protein Dere_GG23958 [Drosophila erecta]